MQQSGFRCLCVVAQCRQRHPAAIEVHREFRRGDGDAYRSLLLERSAYLAVKLGASGRREAIVEDLSEESVTEGVRLLGRIALIPRARSNEPELLAKQLIARIRNPESVAFEHARQGVDAKLEAAHGSRREQQARFVLRAWPGSDR